VKGRGSNCEGGYTNTWTYSGVAQATNNDASDASGTGGNFKGDARIQKARRCMKRYEMRAMREALS
jgi:hypothetical protein